MICYTNTVLKKYNLNNKDSKMSTMNTSSPLLHALRETYKAQILTAKAKIQVYITSPVGVGDHSTLTETIDEQINVISTAHDKLRVIEEYYFDK